MMARTTPTPGSKTSLPMLNTASNEQQSNSFHDTMGEESGTQTAPWCVYASVDVRLGSLPTLEPR